MNISDFNSPNATFPNSLSTVSVPTPEEVVNTSSTDSEFESKIDKLCNMGEKERKGHASSGGISLADLKGIARYLNITQTQSKPALIEAIISRARDRLLIRSIETAENNNNSMPRICRSTEKPPAAVMIRFINFLLEEPDKLKRTQALASRTNLQLGQISHTQDIFIEATRKV
jgi:hypothetical protein